MRRRRAFRGSSLGRVCSRHPDRHGYWPSTFPEIRREPAIDGDVAAARRVIEAGFATQEFGWADRIWDVVVPGEVVGAGPPRSHCGTCGAPTRPG